MICIESITRLCWGGSSRAVIPGVCLALLQGSWLTRGLRFVGIIAVAIVVLDDFGLTHLGPFGV